LNHTIYDIAKAANVSIATVSRVFNESGSVREATKKRVMKIADEMGYHPQVFAQALASKRKNIIAVVVPIMSNYFFMEILAGVQDKLHETGYELNIINIQSTQDQFEQIEHLIRRQRADGYIFISIHLPQSKWQELDRYHVPMSIIDDYSPAHDGVSVNNQKGAYKATSYLIEQGCRNVAMISALESSTPIIERVDGYRKALIDHGLPFRPELIFTGDISYRDGFTEKGGFEAMEKLLSFDPQPDACFCASDVQAIGALKSMTQRNCRIPIISYDNLAVSEYIGLSTVRQPMYEMGAESTRYLLRRIDDPDIEIEHTTYEPELIIRRSSEIPGEQSINGIGSSSV
jgi:LacI family transcriptional regulator